MMAAMRFLFLLLLVTIASLPAGCTSSGTRHLAAEGALGPYSGSVVSGGFCFVSGKIGKRGGSFAEEAETALDAVEAELRRSGLGLADVVSSTVYLTDIALYPELNAIYAHRFRAPYPARTTVAVSKLPGGARLEIQVVARLRGG